MMVFDIKTGAAQAQKLFDEAQQKQEEKADLKAASTKPVSVSEPNPITKP